MTFIKEQIQKIYIIIFLTLENFILTLVEIKLVILNDLEIYFLQRKLMKSEV